ncbi:hypothetical protein Syun_031860 [Stephania yunnanensis]|uniref:Uncharacterized protein n=1 Tax=Stephania yunnanensis TaxID=152371 RepID=A0AAP0DWX2_9MAGN
MAHQADVNRAQIDMLTTEKVEWRPWEDSFHWHQDCVVSAIEHFSGRACLNKIATIAGQPRLGSLKAISYGLENSDKKPNREGLNGWLPRPGLAPAQLTCFVPASGPFHYQAETTVFEGKKTTPPFPSIPNLETESAKSQADELYVKFKKERYSYQAETGTRAENGWKGPGCQPRFAVLQNREVKLTLKSSVKCLGDISDILQQRRPRSGSKGFSSVYQLMIMCYLFDRPFASSVVNSALAWNIFEIPFVKRKFYHISFVAGQPLGYYASWPLFALSPSHGCVVGCRAGSACAAPSVTVYSCATDSQRPDSIAVDEIVVVLQRAKSPLLLLWEKAPSQLSHLNKDCSLFRSIPAKERPVTATPIPCLTNVKSFPSVALSEMIVTFLRANSNGKAENSNSIPLTTDSTECLSPSSFKGKALIKKNKRLSSLALLLPSSVNSISVSPANPYPDLRLPAIPNRGDEYRDYWDNIFICLYQCIPLHPAKCLLHAAVHDFHYTPLRIFLLMDEPGLDHVSRTISVHMAQDDSTYRGRNGIGCFHVSPYCPVCLDFRLMNKKETWIFGLAQNASFLSYSSRVGFQTPLSVSGASALRSRLLARALAVACSACWSMEEGISIAKDSIQPQVPLRLPCYDFTPVEDPTVVCANKTTKSLCGTSGTHKEWVIIGPMLRAKPIPRRTIRTEAIFPDSLRLTALLPIVIAIVARVWPSPSGPCGLDVIPTFLQYITGSPSPPSIPLSFGLATVLPRRSVSRVSWAPDPRRPRANTHRLRHGLPGRGFFLESCHDRALDERALQAALPFFTHAILLDRAFAHCPRFPTAAPRGSPGRVSVPAHQTALFSLIQDLARTVRQIPTRYAPVRHFVLNCSHLLGETSYLELGASFPSAQLPENNVRLACVKHIASVPSEPGSNSDF